MNYHQSIAISFKQSASKSSARPLEVMACEVTSGNDRNSFLTGVLRTLN